MSYTNPLIEWVGQPVRAEWAGREIEGTIEAVTYYDTYANIEPTLTVVVDGSRIAVAPEHVEPR